MKPKINFDAVKQGFEQLKISLNGIDVSTLPADVAAVVTKIRSDADVAIAGIASFTEKVDVANQANGIVSNVEYYLERIAELVGTVQSLATSMSSVSLSVNARIEDTVKKRVTDGDLITKQSHETALEAAREAARADGEAAGRKAILSLNARREKLSAAGLPVPSEDVLALPDDQFDAAVNSAATRKNKVSEAKLSLNGVFGRLMFAPDTEFNTAFDAATESRSAAAASPAAPAKGAVDLNRAGDGPASKTVKPVL